MPLDFHRLVTRYKLRKLKVVRVGRHMSDLFAQEFVLGLTLNKTHARVYRQVALFRNMWAKKLKSLAANQLWLPNTRLLDPHDPSFNVQKFELTFRRLLFCRPTFVQFAWQGAKVWRPCNRSSFCPFCFARVASSLYRHTKRRINKLVEKNPATQLCITVQVLRRFIYAANFDSIRGCHPYQVDMYVDQLKEEIQQHKAAYAKCTKRLQRVTLGSMWRVVVIPMDSGWIIESRQCFIHKPNKQLPVPVLENSVVHYNRTVPVLDGADLERDDFFVTFGEFCRYPVSTLRTYSEFVAAALRAAHNLRMCSGTGILRKTSRSLIRMFKQENLDGKARKKAAQAQTQNQNPEPVQSAPVHCVRLRSSPRPARVPV
jgi:hypothetical protein